MTPRNLSRLVTWCITASLLSSATFGILVCDRASAKSRNNRDDNNDSRNADKVSPDLRTQVRRTHQRSQGNSNNEDVKVILQFNGPASAGLVALLRRSGVHMRKHFNNFNSHMVEFPA